MTHSAEQPETPPAERDVIVAERLTDLLLEICVQQGATPVQACVALAAALTTAAEASGKKDMLPTLAAKMIELNDHTEAEGGFDNDE